MTKRSLFYVIRVPDAQCRGGRAFQTRRPLCLCQIVAGRGPDDESPRSSLLGAAQGGPGGLPRVTTRLNPRWRVKKAKPQRRPSLPPEPLPPRAVSSDVAVAPALVQPPPPVPDAGDFRSGRARRFASEALSNFG